MKRTFLFILLTTLAAKFSYSQGMQWWFNKVNYDGYTPWSRYIIRSPGFLGPNALPVPEVKNGIISNQILFENGFMHHSLKGDKTQNLILKLTYPIAKDIVALDFMWIPIEYFNTDTIIRDERRAWGYDGKGFSTGDLYFGTLLRIFKNSKKFPPTTLGMYFKTASGGNLANARHTDNPGYYFSLTTSKKVEFKNNSLKYAQFSGMVGFYCWQATYANNGNGKNLIDGISNIGDYQDDAPLFGASLELFFNKFSWGESIAGYWGYVNNRDRPIVFRSWINASFTKYDFKVMYQRGIHDVFYNTFTLSLTRKIDAFSKQQNSTN